MVAVPASIEEAIIDAIAAACPAASATITRSTRLLDLGMDSLTLVTVLSQIEILYGVAFETDEVVELLGAEDVSELIATVARTLDR
jgi:acyl carrier protein